MDKPEKGAAPHVAAQTSASWVGRDAAARSEDLANALANRDDALRKAMDESAARAGFHRIAPTHIGQ